MPTAPRTHARGHQRLASTLALIALGSASLPARAQRAATSLDVGGASVRYADTPVQSAATVSPALRVDWARATLATSGSASRLGDGAWSTQGGLDASLFSPAAGLLVGEVSAVAGGSAHQDGTRTGQALGVGRAHLMGVRTGLWAGAGGGSSWSGAGWRPVYLAEGGAWARVGNATALVSATPTVVDDTVRFTDATVAAQVALARADLSALAGVRAAQRGVPMVSGQTARGWGGASATLWITRWAGVVASGGSYPVDPTQGFPGGRYATLGLRLGARAASAAATDATSRRDAADDVQAGGASAPAVLAFRAESAGGGRWTLRAHAPTAARVELIGDVTGWAPVRLTAAGGGWWAVTLPAGHGTHELNVRVNGGEWLVPAGLAGKRDEFGGAVGLLVID